MSKIKKVELVDLENISNELLSQAQELVYTITHFMKKTNQSTALDVRRVIRNISKSQKDFKDNTIIFYEQISDSDELKKV